MNLYLHVYLYLYAYTIHGLLDFTILYLFKRDWVDLNPILIWVAPFWNSVDLLSVSFTLVSLSGSVKRPSPNDVLYCRWICYLIHTGIYIYIYCIYHRIVCLSKHIVFVSVSIKNRYLPSEGDPIARPILVGGISEAPGGKIESGSSIWTRWVNSFVRSISKDNIDDIE